MELIQQDITAPTSFATPPIPLAYQCTFEGRTARLRDAITNTIEVNCDNGLTFADAPALKYASGELTCDQSTSTRPANVVQTYYVRSVFDLTDFRVTVNKSGPHSIVSVDPAAGVVIIAQGTNFVTFGPGPDWVSAAHETRHALGSITYNPISLPVDEEIDKSGSDPDKSIQPPIVWCWQWTNISFGADSYLHDATGRDTFLFQAANRVGTRYVCSNVVYSPGGGGTNTLGPKDFSLLGNSPNPFNPRTTLAFAVPFSAQVTIEVHDLMGRRVTTLVNEMLSAGVHEVVWDGRNESGQPAAAGMYFAVIRADGFQGRHKMTLLK